MKQATNNVADRPLIGCNDARVVAAVPKWPVFRGSFDSWQFGKYAILPRTAE